MARVILYNNIIINVFFLLSTAVVLASIFPKKIQLEILRVGFLRNNGSFNLKLTLEEDDSFVDTHSIAGTVFSNRDFLKK